MFASRNGRHSIRLAAASAFCVGVAALTMVSACSAGNLTQTGSQVAAVPGANVDAGPNGEIALRDVVVLYNNAAGYRAGGSAPLVVRIFNGGAKTVKLVRVTASEAAQRVVLSGTPIVTTSPNIDSSPIPTPITPSATTSATPTGTTSVAPTQESPVVPGRDNVSVEIAPGSYALLVPGKGAFLQLTGLTKPLAPGNLVEVTFSFDNGVSVVATIPFGLPTEPAPRVSAAVGHPE